MTELVCGSPGNKFCHRGLAFLAFFFPDREGRYQVSNKRSAFYEQKNDWKTKFINKNFQSFFEHSPSIVPKSTLYNNCNHKEK